MATGQQIKKVSILERRRSEDLPITFHNFQELQLLMDWFGDSYLPYAYSFFQNCPCPCLEKLFIQHIVEPEESASANLPVTFHNLQELQLLLDGSIFTSLADCNSFFKNCLCPCLEKLFIELTPSDEHPSTCYQYERLPGEDPPEIVFDHLKVIKMTRFTWDEMQLVKYFLERSIVLESLVLVAPQNGVFKMKRILRKWLSIWAKASSSNARILVSEYSEDDGALVPTHTDGDGSLVRTDIY